MVSFWPFKGDDSSTASFEKTLSNLTSKITTGNVKRDALRSRGRRYKALWTLYSCFIYIIYAMIILLISGRSSWGTTEYSAFAGGPVLIYLVRAAISRFYGYRVSTMQAYLDDLNNQKEAAIEKFKAATKYNTTQQLLEKYGAAPSPSPKPADKERERKKSQSSQNSPQNSMPRRTNHPIPPTANIQRQDIVSSRESQDEKMSQGFSGNIDSQIEPVQQAELRGITEAGPAMTLDSAPNTVPALPQYSTAASDRWYDRLMDVIMGEDETRAANRVVLICTSCRLVNGQAPPGVKTPEEIGKWRCASCKAWNGVVNEAETIIEDVAQSASLKAAETESSNTSESTLDKIRAAMVHYNENDFRGPPLHRVIASDIALAAKGLIFEVTCRLK